MRLFTRGPGSEACTRTPQRGAAKYRINWRMRSMAKGPGSSVFRGKLVLHRTLRDAAVLSLAGNDNQEHSGLRLLAWYIR